MRIIEPCCAQRQIRELRNAIKGGGTELFEGYGDMSLTEMLPAVLTRYSETSLLIAAPSLPDQAADIIERWMRRQWSRADGQGKLDAIRHLTIVADLSEEKSPVASGWLKDSPFGDRLTLVGKEQKDTVILLPDFAITGPVNMRYGQRFIATATTHEESVEALWRKYGTVSAVKAGKVTEKTEEPEEKPEEKPVAEADKPAKEPVPAKEASVKEEPAKEEAPKKEKPGPEAGQENG